MPLANRLPRAPWRPPAVPLAVVHLEEATDPKRRARVQAAARHRPGSGHLQADLFRLAWRRRKVVRPTEPGEADEPDDPPTVRSPAHADSNADVGQV